MHRQDQAFISPPGEQALASPSVAASFSPRPLHSRSLFQNILTLATVAAVILAAVGLVNHFSEQPASNTSSGRLPLPNQRVPAVSSYGWDTTLIGLTVLSAAGLVKGFTFYSYNASSGQMAQLISSTSAYIDVSMEGVSQDGQSLLYDVTATDAQKTYLTYSRSLHAHRFYRLNARQGGNAIWMDSEHILVQDIDGAVMALDVHAGTISHTWSLKTGRLIAYHAPFLYFSGVENLVAGALYRIDLAEVNSVPQQITQATPGTRFWLSIDGSTVFFANKGSSGEEGIYAVGSDGTNLRLLRSGPGMPIGYAANNALMLLEQAGNRLQVIQMGIRPNESARILLADAVPGATSLCGSGGRAVVIEICDANVALAPYGQGLLLHAYYANGTHSLVYDDLATGTSRGIRTLPANTAVQLPGWSKMAVPSSSVGDQASCLCA
jgi:hypothetical protein